MPDLERTLGRGSLDPHPCVRQRLVRFLLTSLVGLLTVLTLPTAAFAIDEYPVPTPSSWPGGITVGPDGAMWFTEENGPPGALHKIGRLCDNRVLPCAQAPTIITEYEIPSSAATPLEIVTGPDNALWFTEFGANPPKIGRLCDVQFLPCTPDPAGIIKEHTLPSGSAPDGITVGPDGALWFTEIGTKKIGRITTGGSDSHSNAVAGGALSDIVTGPDGRLWFTESDPFNKIGVIEATDPPGTAQEFDRPGADPSGIVASGASLWVTHFFGSRIEQLATSGATVKLFPTGPEPSGITFGPDQAIWFTEATPNKIGRMTTGGSVTEFAVPTPGSAPNDIAAGPDGALWFTEFNGNNIGRIAAGSGSGILPPPPPPPTGPAKASVLSLRVSPKAFRAAPRGASVSAKVGAKVTYRLSASASTRFTVERETVGRKKGKRCVKPTRRNRRAKRCKLYKTVRGSFSDRGKAGSNSFRFTGRIGNKKLRPGRYRLVAAVGTSKSAKRASFKIVRR